MRMYPHLHWQIGDARGPHVSLFLTMPPTITAKHLPPIGSPSILQSEKTLCFVVWLVLGMSLLMAGRVAR